MKSNAKVDPTLNRPLNGPSTIVTIRAISCERREDGMWDVRIPTKEMTSDVYKMLEQHFPNTMRQVERALDTEVLLAAIE